MRARSLLPLLAILLLAPAAHAQLSAVRLASGLTLPTTVAAPPGDERLFVVERAGTIRILSGGTLLGTPFLDITDRVCTTGEGGLLGLAFPPDFAATGHFFVYYTAERSGVPQPCQLESRVSRFTVDGDPASNQADASSEAIFFSIDQPQTNHNGGTIAIRDGWLYLGLGDGGGGGDPNDLAQDDGSLFGKMLRFDLSDDEPPWQPVVWAKGFRNPFRFSFDRATGDLYVGDVGQNHWEEIDVEPADSPGGLNYGWDVEEGFACFQPNGDEPPCGHPSLVEPVFVYEHSDAPFCGGSVTGGSVYRGNASPSLQGRYFFADFCEDWIWSLRWNPATGEAEDVVEHTGAIPADAGSLANVVAIAEDGDGELVFVDMTDGELFRLVPEPGAGGLAAAAALAALLARGRRAALSARRASTRG